MKTMMIIFSNKQRHLRLKRKRNPKYSQALLGIVILALLKIANTKKAKVVECYLNNMKKMIIIMILNLKAHNTMIIRKI
jgi:hypothetical protein